ncbi:MAG: UDP-N-acetylenolpyruvoylglucosamine reductase [Verrucomicrobiales bacterium]|nr:UDP-N-acetylenolpyruvoylglucosamine reductase [Verrucomicrobiales bacterium]
MTVAEQSIANDLRAVVSAETRILLDEPLSKKTTLRVGGPADVFVEPASENDLAEVLKICSRDSIPTFILGRGSNLLIRDAGIRGVVVGMGHACFSYVEVDGLQIKCGAGARLKQVSVEARRNHVGGLEFLEGIPGSVGGALRMNAGAMGMATFEVVNSIRIMDHEGKIQTLMREEVEVHYRCCELLKHHLAISAIFHGKSMDRSEIEKKASAYNDKRWSSQPAAPSAGCIFKNPAEVPAGKLIEELGLKGRKIGGASISNVHGNFIINEGQAKAADVLQLIELIKQEAKIKRGLELQTEVEIVGEDPS